MSDVQCFLNQRHPPQSKHVCRKYCDPAESAVIVDECDLYAVARSLRSKGAGTKVCFAKTVGVRFIKRL